MTPEIQTTAEPEERVPTEAPAHGHTERTHALTVRLLHATPTLVPHAAHTDTTAVTPPSSPMLAATLTDTAGWFSVLQKKTWHEVEEKYQQLLMLQERPPEEVFGDTFAQAFIPRQQLESGACTLCVGCMDERVPGPKIGLAGSGVLMTDIPENAQSMSDEEIYAYLSAPASGNALFHAFVDNLTSRREQGWKLQVSEHAGCGAVGIFCRIFRIHTERKLDAEKVARAVAKRLHTALGLPGTHRRADYQQDDIPMNGDAHIHDAYCLVIDGTGRIDLDTLGIRGLLLSSAKYVQGSDPDMSVDADDYLQEEVEKGTLIIGSEHGVGLKDPPIVLIGDPTDPECSVESLKSRLGDVTKGRTVIEITAPGGI